MNLPETVQFTHRLFFNTPAYVVNGSFSENAVNTTETGPVYSAYIGAKYISIFYERNLKIYTNILNRQLVTRKKRILLIMGQVHAGILQELFQNNENYIVVSPLQYLKS